MSEPNFLSKSETKVPDMFSNEICNMAYPDDVKIVDNYLKQLVVTLSEIKYDKFDYHLQYAKRSVLFDEIKTVTRWLRYQFKD